MLKQYAVSLYPRVAMLRHRPVVLFAGLGLLSGAGGAGVVATKFLTGYLIAVAFGVAICVALYLTTRPKWPRLAIAFLAVQLAWQAALETGAYVHKQIHDPFPLGFMPDLWGHRPKRSAEPIPDRSHFPNSPFWRYGREMVLPGLTAGAVGAAGTWLGAVVCAAALRRLAAFAFAVLAGALAGLFLGFNSPLFFTLFPIWQMAVAASLGFWVPTFAAAPIGQPTPQSSMPP
jgi:hypothetical protein